MVSKMNLPNRFCIALLVLVFLLSLASSLVEAKIRYHRWEVKYQFQSPDCFRRLVIAINGRTPGPTIHAQQGDTIVVELKNGLFTENIAIHWHGIRQPGTYIYHAHYGMQREAGLYGSIQVLVPDGVSEPFSYDVDRSIILNDWYHLSNNEQATGLSSKPFVWVGEPQSLLIQGKGRYDCSSVNSPDLVCNATNPECSPYVMTVVPRKTYRLRITSVTSLSALNFEIEGHSLTVVEADGHYVNPFVVNNLNIYSGETYSVLVKTDQDPSRNYWAAVNVIARNRTTPTGVAIFNYYPNHPRKIPPTSPPAGPVWNDTLSQLNQSLAIKSHPNYIHKPPPNSQKLIKLLNTQNQIDGFIRWSVNNISFVFPHTPYLIALKHNMTHAFDQNPAPETYPDNYDIYSVAGNPNASYSDSIFRLEFNSTVDIILQNANTLSNNNSETHPWHMHGHDFWVLGFGIGVFDPVKDAGKLNLVDPIMKNTVPIFPFGWTAIRFQADNPGVWAFHCHIESHFHLGMAVVFEEGIERVGNLPTSIMGCGETRDFIKP